MGSRPGGPHRRGDPGRHLPGSATTSPRWRPLRAPGRRAGRVPALELPPRPRLHRPPGSFVGYALAVLSILGTAKVAVALLVLGVPIIDTFWIIVRRTRREVAFTADRGHLHHRLLDLGISHRGAVLTIYALCVLALLSSPVGLGPAVRLPGPRGGRWPRPLPADREGARYRLQRAHRQRLRGGPAAGRGRAGRTAHFGQPGPRRLTSGPAW